MRWTVRGIDVETVRMVQEVALVSGITLGACLNDAIAFWYEQLPESDDDPSAENHHLEHQ